MSETKMTTYEFISKKIDQLTRAGQSPSINIGQREQYFTEAQRLRETLESLSVEEAECVLS